MAASVQTGRPATSCPQIARIGHQLVYFAPVFADMYGPSINGLNGLRSDKSITVPVLPGGTSPFLPRRRDMLAYLGASVAGAAYASSVRAQTPPALIQTTLGEGQRFDPAIVMNLARQLSRKPFNPAPNDLPDVFSNLNYDQYVAIKSLRPPIWGNDGRGIAFEPLHRGFVFSNAIDLFIVEDGVVRRVNYEPTQFDYGTPHSSEQSRRCRLFGLPADRDLRRRQAVRFRNRAGGDLLSRDRARPEFRSDRPRLDPQARRSQGRGVPDLPRLLARTARGRQQQHHDSRGA